MKPSDIAAKIDAMTLDELMGNAGLPEPGGDYDTKKGWAKRMGVDKTTIQFKTAWDKLDNAGLIKPVKGRIKRTGSWATTTLYHCPTLARKLDK